MLSKQNHLPYISTFLLCALSLLFSNCGHKSNEKIDSPTSAVCLNANEESHATTIHELASPTYHARGGHQVWFYLDQGSGELRAKVAENLPIGLSCMHDNLQVGREYPAIINTLKDLNEKSQSRLIHAYLGGREGRKYVYIGKMGLPGGGKPNKKTIKYSGKAEKKDKEKIIAPEQPEKISIVQASIKTGLGYPKPQHFNPSSYNRGKSSPAAMDKLIQDALKLKLQAASSPTDDPQTLKLIFDKLMLAAQFKHKATQATYLLGMLCEEIQGIDAALKWYILSFKNSWFENPINAYQTQAYQKLITLSNAGHEAAAKVLILYPCDVEQLLQKVLQCRTLLKYYKQVTAGAYLNEQETIYQINRLEEEISRLELPVNLDESKAVENYENGVKHLQTGNYKAAEGCFLAYPQTPESLHNLGGIYENGYLNNGKPDYTKAEKYYLKAKTSLSFYNIGRFYHKGFIGEQPDYQKAKFYYELSGNKGALNNLGILYEQGKLGQKPDYKQAEICYKLSGSKDAVSNLGILFQDGKIGEAPDNKQAAVCFQKSGTPDALYHLGGLYEQGKIDNQPNFKEAAVCFQKSGTPDALHRLGVLYEQGKIGDGKPNFEKALGYYQQSNTAYAKLAIFALYHFGFLDCKTQEIKNNILDQKRKDLETLLPTIPPIERYYLQGWLAYMRNDYEQSLIAFQHAILFGLKKHKTLDNLINKLSKYLIKEKEETKPEQALSLASEEHANDTYPAKETLDPDLELLKDEESEDEESEDEKSIQTAENTNLKTGLADEQAENKDQPPVKKPVKKSKKETKEAKQLRRRKRLQSAILATRAMPLEMDTNYLGKTAYVFLNPKRESAFQTFKAEHISRVERLLESIEENQWEAKGIGKPEVLMYHFMGYKNCISRRIDGEIRLIYKVLAPGEILVLDWEKHYKKK